MLKSTKSRLISFLLVVALMFSLMFASVVPTNAVTDISSPGGSGESKVVTTVAPSIFSVTVPYVLPISVAADGIVSVADNAAITNNSNGPIIVSSAEITGKNGWEIVDSSTDFQTVPVNSKQLTLSMMGEPIDVSGSVDTSLFRSINGNSSLNISYDADAAVQGDALSNQNVADVLFTVEWDSYELSGDVVSKTALSTFASSNNLKTFQRTTESLNLDDVLADDRMVKIDNAPVVTSGKSRAIASGASAETEPVIYAWSDDDGNGYWWSNADKVYLPADCSGMFKNCKLTELDLSNFDTSNVTNMSEMFSNCTNLTSLDLSNFDTSNVTDMKYMFDSCSSLTSLDISSFDTSKIEDMSYMFIACSKLTSLNLSNFDTSNVTTMGWMFTNCSSLTSLDLSSFDTSKVTNMSSMFGSCSNLTSLNLLLFDTSNVIDMSYMFSNCSKLTSLDLSSFDTSNMRYMSYMFEGCSSLASLDILSFDTNKVTNMSYMFSGCSSLTSLDLSSFNTSKVAYMSGMFSGCSSLASLDVSSFDTSSVTYMSAMFRSCSSLTSLNLSSFNTSKVTSMNLMFYDCSSLISIYVSDFNTDKVTNSSTMFTGCTKLIGQNGTTYNLRYTSKTYARIDTEETPGYFTYKAKSAA